jgi:hypothetical protein
MQKGAEAFQSEAQNQDAQIRDGLIRAGQGFVMAIPNLVITGLDAANKTTQFVNDFQHDPARAAEHVLGTALQAKQAIDHTKRYAADIIHNPAKPLNDFNKQSTSAKTEQAATFIGGAALGAFGAEFNLAKSTKQLIDTAKLLPEAEQANLFHNAIERLNGLLRKYDEPKIKAMEIGDGSQPPVEKEPIAQPSDAFVKHVESIKESFSEAQKQWMKEHKVDLEPIRRITDVPGCEELANAAGVFKREGGRQKIYVAEEFLQARQWKPNPNPDQVAQHEFGHALNAAAPSEHNGYGLSDHPEFRRAYRADIESHANGLPLEINLARFNSDRIAIRDEVFAEMFAHSRNTFGQSTSPFLFSVCLPASHDFHSTGTDRTETGPGNDFRLRATMQSGCSMSLCAVPKTNFLHRLA